LKKVTKLKQKNKGHIYLTYMSVTKHP